MTRSWPETLTEHGKSRPDAGYHQPAADVVGVDPPAGLPGSAGGAGGGGRGVGRSGVLRSPYRAFFSELLGRPSIPIETYLRMMFLKHRYGLGYETLVPGGRGLDSPGPGSAGSRWAPGCRTRPRLGKLTTRCGPEVIDAAERGAAGQGRRGQGDARRTRCGRTPRWSPANVTYPTDSGLLVRAITLIIMLVARDPRGGGGGAGPGCGTGAGRRAGGPGRSRRT